MRTPAIASLFLLACGGSPSMNPGSPDGSGSNMGSDSGSGSDGFVELVGRDWMSTPGQEHYECAQIAVPQEMWVTGFRAENPQGTHHQVVTISSGGGTPKGDYDCNAGALDSEMLYAAGVGTDDLLFPDGVATHIAAGTLVNVNLHLFNLTDQTLTGHSGVAVKTIDASQVVNQADMEFSGTFTINVPSDGQPHDAVGGCTAPADWHIFTLWPHMHQTATHQKFTVNGTALLDDDYAFAEQKNYPIADTLLHKGDTIQTTCTYVNNTGKTMNFGESSTDEMCFTGMYKYPADGNVFGCTSGVP